MLLVAMAEGVLCLNVWRILNCLMFRRCQLTLKPSEIVKRRAPVSWLNGYLTTWYNLAILVFYRLSAVFAAGSPLDICVSA